MNFLFSPYGRISRKTYLLSWIVPYVMISLVAFFMDAAVRLSTPGGPRIFGPLLGLALFWPSIAITTKRLHDRGMTGWWNVAPYAVFIPLGATVLWTYSTRLDPNAPSSAGINPAIAGVVWILVLAVVAWVILYPAINAMFLPGQRGPNKYGADPLDNVDTIRDTFA